MSSLRERAKTLVEIIKASCSYVYLTRCKDCMGKCEFEGTESFAGKWVRLEDAEEALLDRLIPFEQEVSILQKERLELKQKLRQFAKFLDDFYKRRRSQIVRPKFYEIFGELLKDGNE